MRLEIYNHCHDVINQHVIEHDRRHQNQSSQISIQHMPAQGSASTPKSIRNSESLVTLTQGSTQHLAFASPMLLL
jgi:hypothetical protein